MRTKTYYWIIYRDSKDELNSVCKDHIGEAKKVIKQASSFLIAWRIVTIGKKETLEVYDCSDKTRIGQKYTKKYYSKKELKKIRQ
jgi:hypothetical protein